MGVEFAACVVDFEVLHVLGSDHFPIKLSLQLSRMFNVPSLPHSSRISRAQALRRLRQDWTDEETKTLKDRFCSEEILDKLKGLCELSSDPEIITGCLSQLLHEEAARVLKRKPPKIGPFDNDCKLSKLCLFSLLNKVKNANGPEQRQEALSTFRSEATL